MLQSNNNKPQSDWYTITPENPLVIETINQVNSVALSPDGRFIASAGGNENGNYTINIWDPITGKQVGDGMKGHTGSIKAINYSKCGKYIVSAGSDKTVRQWKLDCQQQITQTMPLESEVIAVYYSPDSRYLVSVQLNEIINVWDPSTGQEDAHKRKEITRIFEPYVWDGEESTTWKSQTRISASSPAQYEIVFGGDNTKLFIWNYQEGNAEVLQGRDIGYLNSLSYSNDGKLIVSGCNLNCVTLWDAISRQQIRQVVSSTLSSIDSVAISPDMKYIITGTYYILQLWDIETGKKISQQHLSWKLKSLQYSLNGKYLITRWEDAQIRIMIAPIQEN